MKNVVVYIPLTIAPTERQAFKLLQLFTNPDAIETISCLGVCRHNLDMAWKFRIEGIRKP